MKIPRQSPLKQIRKQCLDCCGGGTKSVRFCPDTECPLWCLRFGKSTKAFINKNGETYKELFNKDNFKVGGKYSPNKPVDEMEV